MPKQKFRNAPPQFKKYFPEPLGTSENIPVSEIVEEKKLKPNEAYCRVCNELSTFPFVIHREWKAPICKRCWQSEKIGPINFPVGTNSKKPIPQTNKKTKIQRKTWQELGINPNTLAR